MFFFTRVCAQKKMPVDGFQIYQIVLIALYFVFVVLCSYQIWLSFSLEFGELKLIFDRSFVLMGTLGVTTHSTILALSINGNTYPIRNFAAVTYDLRTIIGIYAFSELVRLTIEQTRMAVEMEADAFDVFQIFPGVYCLLFASMITTQVLRAQYNSFAWGIIVNCALTAILSTLLFVLWSFAWRFHQHMNELNTRLNLAPGDPKSASSTAFIRFLVLVSIVVVRELCYSLSFCRFLAACHCWCCFQRHGEEWSTVVSWMFFV